jgi:hypothetical protein
VLCAPLSAKDGHQWYISRAARAHEQVLTVPGLLPLLKSIQKPCTLKKFDGKTLGVDAYGWLHRGTVACAMELALGKPTRRCALVVEETVPHANCLQICRLRYA